MRALFVSLAVFFFFSDAAEARGRGGRLLPSRNTGYNTTYSAPQTSVPQAPQGVVDRTSPLKDRILMPIDVSRIGAHEVNYRYAYENPQFDNVGVQIDVQEKYTQKLGKAPVVAARYFELKHDKKFYEATEDVEIVNANTLRFRIRDLARNNIYRMDFFFYNNDGDEPQHVFTATNYYAVTADESLEAQARHQLVTLALIEAHDWSVGRTNHRNARYNTGFSGGWCGIFQRDFFERFTRAFDYTNGDWPGSGFARYSEVVAGNQLPNYAAAGPVHGNFGFLGYHKFMVLGYSLDSGLVYSLDGNSNNFVRISTKGLGKVGTFGVINDRLAWEENLGVFPDSSSRTWEEVEAEIKARKEAKTQEAAEKAAADKAASEEAK